LEAVQVVPRTRGIRKAAKDTGVGTLNERLTVIGQKIRNAENSGGIFFLSHHVPPFGIRGADTRSIFKSMRLSFDSLYQVLWTDIRHERQTLDFRH
jgi:hypothetical protein